MEKNTKKSPGLRNRLRKLHLKPNDNQPIDSRKMELRKTMPSCFVEMWDVFLSFSRLNY